VTPTWIPLRDFKSMMKKAKSQRKKRSVICKKSHAQIELWFCRKVAQFCPPGLLKRTCLISFWMVRLHT
jgi:hypothetical protein